jgi:hypothetical protein
MRLAGVGEECQRLIWANFGIDFGTMDILHALKGLPFTERTRSPVRDGLAARLSSGRRRKESLIKTLFSSKSVTLVKSASLIAFLKTIMAIAIPRRNR